MKVRDIVKMIEKDGWFMLARTATSHKHYKHPVKPGRVTIAGAPGDDLTPKMKSSILKQAGLK